ncbi:MAG TPA: carboxypeptidase M32 [Miltoncostaeaceae bacterium]|nr:carboxypeptidase M32 [Miltoncostaeaceae bacterium]
MSTSPVTAWQRFTDWCGTLADIGGTLSMLGWDRETVMPRGGAESRARQMGTLSAILHRELTRADLTEPLEELHAGGGLPPERARQVALMRRQRAKALRVPESLVRALSEARSRSVSTWIRTRPSGDYAAFAVPFTEVVRLRREEAALLAESGEHYDALLDEFEPGARVATLEPVFADLRARLAPLVAACADRRRPELPARAWPVEAQLALAREIAEMVGYDADRGYITTSAHPFTSSPGTGDVRFTTRLSEADPVGNVMAVMHEAGHALYEQGFPGDWARTALADAPSLAAHESQSRFWENHLARTGAFWAHIEPVMRTHLPDAMRDLRAADLHRVAAAVQPTLIRVDADEVTYNLHIALRFELEVALFRGDIEVPDLPAAWDARMTELLGVTPAGPAEGVMQDVHWPEGVFGYFPTYTLGSLYAAQLAESAAADLGDLEAVVAEGRFADVLAWMRHRVHRHGRLFDTDELMRRATGRELSADALVAHLERLVAATADV